VLFYSRAAVSEITAGSAGWSAPRQFAPAAYSYSMAASSNGRLHMTYISTRNTVTAPAGVAYRQSNDGGATWTDPITIYQSDYLRSLLPSQANLKLAAEGENKVYAVWDNPGLDSVFFIRSTDGGETWSEPFLVDERRPEDPTDALGPNKINMLVNGNDLNVTWGASHAEEQCTQYYRQSTDGGATWSEPQAVFEGGIDCPVNGRLALGNDGLLFLITTTEDDNVYMQAQDGDEWSRPQPQTPLDHFTNPETYRVVDFDCQQTLVNAANELLVLGCGSSNDEDIWLIRRPLGGIERWSSRFEPTPVWSQPVPIATAEVELLPPQMVIGGDGRIHAFWSQSDNSVGVNLISDPLNTPGNTIYYSRFDAGAWSAPRPVLTSPGEGTKADEPTVGADDQGLFVAWSGNNPEGIYFSRALAERAASVTEWIDPLPLPAPRDAGSGPSMITDGDSTIYVAYTIPLNEERGIYLTLSEDEGDTWADAVRIFDGLSNDWEVVGQPHLTRTEDGTLHVLWTRLTQVPDLQAVALAYSRSEDNGQTWSEPEIVTEETVLDSAILGIGERIVHRIWTGLIEGRPVLWHQFSMDGGITWSNRGRVSDPGITAGPTTLIADLNDNPLIVQLAQSNSGQLVLQQWLWTEERWLLGDRRVLSDTNLEADSISAIAAPDGSVAVIYGALLTNAETAQFDDTLVYVDRQWEDRSEATRTPLPTLTPTPEPLPTNTPVIEPSPTPTATFAPAVSPGLLGSSTGGFVVGIAAAILVVTVIFAVGWRIVRSR